MTTTAQRTESATVIPARQYYRVKDAARALGCRPGRRTTWSSTSRSRAGGWGR